MQPLFFPDPPNKPDIKQYVCCLLRAGGIEDAGWDPYAESRGVVNDLFHLMKMELPDTHFEDADRTVWRLGLLFYLQILEMSAPYEVLANLLRYRLGLGYSLLPFDDFLSKNEKSKSKRFGLSPKIKIRVISDLSKRAELPIGEMFEEFYRPDIRNSVSHSDFIFTESGFRSRGVRWSDSFKVAYEELDAVLNKAKIFIGSFFSLEEEARRIFGSMAGRAYGYDPIYKGMFEFLASEEGLLEGFKVHWPNGEDSYYRRNEGGADCVNCTPMIEPPGLELFVGLYARKPGTFSPLVEVDGEPIYSPLDRGGPRPWWSANGPSP